MHVWINKTRVANVCRSEIIKKESKSNKEVIVRRKIKTKDTNEHRMERRGRKENKSNSPKRESKSGGCTTHKWENKIARFAQHRLEGMMEKWSVGDGKMIDRWSGVTNQGLECRKRLDWRWQVNGKRCKQTIDCVESKIRRKGLKKMASIRRWWKQKSRDEESIV